MRLTNGGSKFCSYLLFVGSEIDFICVSLVVGYYSDKFSDEGHE
jgi:hypothetical protein